MADVITRLRLESGEFDNKIKRATAGLLQMEQDCRRTGNSLANLGKSEQDFVRGLGKMETVSKTARGKVGELTTAFTELSLQYKRLSDTEKNSEFGKALSASLAQLKQRIGSAKQDLADVDAQLGKSSGVTSGFSSALGELGGKLGINGDLMGIVTTGTMGYAAAIGAAVTAVVAATKAWADFNSELAKQDTITSVTTGLKGADADALTDAARSMAQVYGADFREVINAANTLMKQFGVSGSDAIQLIRDGMQGMIEGDAPKLLQMIQQYAPSFRDAGISASQLVAIIHNSEGGIFTDANMNAIVMGIKNIRLMTKATGDALAKVGIDGAEMTRKLNDGSMTIFQALSQVSTRIQQVGASSQAAGEVLQAVFGRLGAAAGANIGKAIETLNLNLNETKTQTGAIGEAFAELEKATEKLNARLREVVGVEEWDVLEVKLRQGIVQGISDAVDGVIVMRKTFVDAANAINTAWAGITDSLGIVGTALQKLLNFGVSTGPRLFSIIATINLPLARMYNLLKLIGRIGGIGNLVGDIKDTFDKDKAEAHFKKFKQWYKKLIGDGEDPQPPENPPVVPPTPPVKSSPAAPRQLTEEEKNNELIEAKKKIYIEVSDAAKKLSGAELEANQKRREALRQEIAALQARNAELQRYEDEALGKVKTTPDAPAGSIKALTEELKKLKEQQSLATTAEEFQTLQKKIDETSSAIDRLQGHIATLKTGFSGVTTSALSAWKKLQEESLASMQVGTADYTATYANIIDTQSLSNIINESVKRGVNLDTSTLEGIWEGILDPDSLDESVREKMQALVDTINATLAEGVEPIKINLNTGNVVSETKKVESGWSEAAKAVQSIGSALSQVEDPALKISGLIAQAIANITLGFSKALNGGTMLPWEWIAAAAAGTATMISTVAAIKAVNSSDAGKYAEGGIIPGNFFSGDNLTASVNSGELILNRSQQDAIASQLNEDSNRMGILTAQLSGEDLFLVINNHLARIGRGELVTSR